MHSSNNFLTYQVYNDFDYYFLILGDFLKSFCDFYWLLFQRIIFSRWLGTPPKVKKFPSLFFGWLKDLLLKLSQKLWWVILICLVLTNPEYPALIKFHIFRIRKSGIAISYKRAPPMSSFTRLFQTRPTSGIFPHPHLPTPHSFPSSKGLDSTSTFGPPEGLMTSIHPSVHYHFFRAYVFIRNLSFPKSG